jgi:hypothetical protein
MINGSHFLLYSRDPEADRSFFRDVLDFRSVNAGGGWLIFALPAAEAAIHPLDEQSSRRNEGQDMLEGALYLMCEDLDAMIESLRMKNVECTPVQKARWGSVTQIPLPSGGKIGLYQPTHPTALDLIHK